MLKVKEAYTNHHRNNRTNRVNRTNSIKVINDRRTTSRQVDKSTRIKRYRATVELNLSRVNDQLVRPPDLVTTKMNKIRLTDRMMYSMVLNF